MRKTFIVLLLAFGLIGCSSSFTVKTYDETKYDLTRGRSMSASAAGFQLLLVIPIRVGSRQERAYAELEKKAKGGMITDVEIQESWYYALVGTSYSTTLRAMVYPLK